MTVILQICKRTGALAEDCGGNFACDNSCDLEDVEFVRADIVEQIATFVEERSGSALANWIRREFG